MPHRSLTLTVNAGVAVITLTQPEIRNAFSDEVILEITEAFRTAGARPDVRAIVLAAEGTAFCAGANLNWMRRMADYSHEENLVDAGKLAAMLHAIYTCPQPTIAPYVRLQSPYLPAVRRPGPPLLRQRAPVG